MKSPADRFRTKGARRRLRRLVTGYAITTIGLIAMLATGIIVTVQSLIWLRSHTAADPSVAMALGCAIAWLILTAVAAVCFLVVGLDHAIHVEVWQLAGGIALGAIIAAVAICMGSAPVDLTAANIWASPKGLDAFQLALATFVADLVTVAGACLLWQPSLRRRR